MAANFVQQQKTQRLLMLVFLGVLCVTGLVLWKGFSKEDRASSFGGAAIGKREIKIDWNVLKDPLLKELQPFTEIQPIEEKVQELEPGELLEEPGRENPFVPY